MRPTENSIHAQEANPHIKPDDQAFYAPREKRISEIMQAPDVDSRIRAGLACIVKTEQAIDAGDFDPQTGKREVCSVKKKPRGGPPYFSVHCHRPASPSWQKKKNRNRKKVRLRR